MFQPEGSASTPQSHSTFYETAIFADAEPSTQASLSELDQTVDTVAPITSPREPTVNPSDIWFLSPETWTLDHMTHLDVSQIPSSMLKRYPTMIRRWLSQWASEGANPFIHRQLYRHRFPRCIQDACTALSYFDSKTTANEETAYRILQDRAEQLLRDNVLDDSPALGVKTLDTFDHLARVQALIVYQTLGLFDSDVGLRYAAEQRIPLLFTWADKMLESASQSASLAAFHRQMTTAPEDSLTMNNTPIAYNPLPHAVGEEALWHAWILAESVRRTWSIVSGIQTVFLTLQRGWAACLGGMMLTTRQGVWDTNSAYKWAKLCSEVNVGLMHRQETERLLVDAKANDVDSFGKVIMEATFGSERIERWIMKSKDRP
ncbi:hypothetical protein A1O3_05403 [Capronia epimyces CBS 606.96]|uniref:Transcription factor domain-containing protein n=1 Tax=Capronia epimyces CBS 606.96 TaxID=1182542 RepID=W9XVY2_9EURO|nr:uncharacterized protein A1O3_05403 [Capronia epimyces CBS 606.96]EXJ84732.1 hypothetical protein A1O3_05403 [Capronia epimyces CBS 606.96]